MKLHHTGLLFVLLLLAACGSSSSSTASSSATASATVTSTPTASASPTPDVPCHFIGSLQNIGSYTGHSVLSVVLSNNGATSCVLNGYPTVVLRDGSGHVAASPSEQKGGGQAATATPSTVTVAVGGSARFVLEFTDISSGPPCATVATAEVTLPGRGGALSVTFGDGFAPCPPSFNVGAITT